MKSKAIRLKRRAVPIEIVHLYAKEMNIYGDTGNRLVLQKRLEWRNIVARVTAVGVGDKMPMGADIIIAGGGQDAVQSSIQGDLVRKAGQLRAMADDGVVMLLVCGSYQLFGRRFITHTGEEIKGIDILPLETTAGPDRLIGNLAFETAWGEVVGYENHSGLTVLDKGAQPLGKVKKGAGNNGKDKTEGCLHKNIFGTYSHGPVLSKNPRLADELLRRALDRRFTNYDFPPLDDHLEHQAAKLARKRPR